MMVEIRPIEKAHWHGKSGQEAFARPKTVMPLVNTRTMKYEVDITEEKLKEYGELLGQDLSLSFSNHQDAKETYWDQYKNALKLPNMPIFFNLDNPREYLKYAIARGSQEVANSLEEYEAGLFPEATHLIANSNEEIEVKAAKAELRKTAMVKSMELSLERKVEIIFLLTGVNCKKQSPSFISLKLDEITQKQTKEFIDLVTKDKASVSTEYLIANALRNNILRQNGDSIYYYEQLIGVDMQATIDYFNDDINQRLKHTISEKLS